MQLAELLDDRRKKIELLFAELEDLHGGLLGVRDRPQKGL
jgi:hypothetical protein